MARVNELQKHLKEGRIYRRAEMAAWSNAVDRHVSLMVKDGSLQKLSPGLYYVPKKTAFGFAPPEDEVLVRSFLKDDDFLLTSPNAYNGLGVGTTQLYNKRVVYNHKRHGEFKLGGKSFSFHCKHRFPKKLTREFLLVDLVNNLKQVAEDPTEVLKNVLTQARTAEPRKLKQSVAAYGTVKAKALFAPVLKAMSVSSYAH